MCHGTRHNTQSLFFSENTNTGVALQVQILLQRRWKNSAIQINHTIDKALRCFRSTKSVSVKKFFCYVKNWRSSLMNNHLNCWVLFIFLTFVLHVFFSFWHTNVLCTSWVSGVDKLPFIWFILVGLGMAVCHSFRIIRIPFTFHLIYLVIITA